jgi:ketosteroid isomerase-like protein
MVNIRKLTEDYIAAFDSRDLDQIAELLAEGFELTDPDVMALTPKKKVLEYIKHLFDAHESLSFEAHLVLVDGDVSVIHFTLTLDSIVLDGVDMITWKSGHMTSMKAYLTPQS